MTNKILNMNNITAVIYYDKDSKTSSFLHSDQRSVVSKNLTEFFEKKFTLTANLIWQSAEVTSGDRITVFITMDHKHGINDVENGVLEIFEKAEYTKECIIKKRTIIIHFLN
jgi:hypothetical protein